MVFLLDKELRKAGRAHLLLVPRHGHIGEWMASLLEGVRVPGSLQFTLLLSIEAAITTHVIAATTMHRNSYYCRRETGMAIWLGLHSWMLVTLYIWMFILGPHDLNWAF